MYIALAVLVVSLGSNSAKSLLQMLVLRADWRLCVTGLSCYFMIKLASIMLDWTSTMLSSA